MPEVRLASFRGAMAAIDAEREARRLSFAAGTRLSSISPGLISSPREPGS